MAKKAVSVTIAALAMFGVAGGTAYAATETGDTRATGEMSALATWVSHGTYHVYECNNLVAFYEQQGISAKCEWHPPLATDARELFVWE
ncbi:hypothetical protein UO65_2585 [Actinokineospora spheciospongiae]|uniref:Secreted protein n=1 Tax=Actinokineospora spheciospongiae TaxID=909613 RepID=W7IZU4_9PSEU|nr:hypothetical protein [Actinokineospora spheciospongiae]EWC62071.1 hypothetical protein UO65_2585 [Actinokineospora spheciospongiae]